jgi:hypothetical protein
VATLATVYHRLFTKDLEASEASARAASARARDASVQLRTFPNEDICFYVKRLDNSGVVREADPRARGNCWKLIGSVVAAAILLIAVLLPSAYGLLAGYQVQSLRQEAQRLATEQTSLELRETALVSPARMEELAREQQFVDPAPQKVVYLDSNKSGSLAMNRK